MKNLIEDKHEVNKVYKEIQITQGKKNNNYPSQQEMLNLTGSKRNANQSHNGIQIPTVPIVKSSMRRLKETIFFSLQNGDKI